MKKVDFDLLYALARECSKNYPIDAVISMLAMDDVPMSDAVIRLGVVMGVLQDDYHYGWSKEGK